MPRIAMELNGRPVEVDLSLSEFKDLMGLTPSNGHSAPTPARRAGKRAKPVRRTAVNVADTVTDQPGGFPQFFAETTDRGRNFITVLRGHPRGIDATSLATALGFAKPVQIGGLIGGGSMSKLAAKHGVDMSKVYRKTIKFQNGVRTVFYYPEQLISKMEESPHE